MSNNLNSTLGNRIKKLRVAKHLTQQGLATRLGLANASTISYFEKGKRLPSIEILYEMAKLFDVSVSFLLEGEDTTNLTHEHIMILGYIDSLNPSEKKFLLCLLKKYLSDKH